MKKVPDFYCVRSMRFPAVKNNIYFFIGVFAKQILKAFDNNKAVFPVIEPIVYISCMDINCRWHLQQAFHFLLCRIFYFLLFSVDITTILFYCYLCLLVKT